MDKLSEKTDLINLNKTGYIISSSGQEEGNASKTRYKQNSNSNGNVNLEGQNVNTKILNNKIKDQSQKYFSPTQKIYKNINDNNLLFQNKY